MSTRMRLGKNFLYASSSRAGDGPDAPPRPSGYALAPAPLLPRAGRLARETQLTTG